MLKGTFLARGATKVPFTTSCGRKVPFSEREPTLWVREFAVRVRESSVWVCGS